LASVSTFPSIPSSNLAFSSPATPTLTGSSSPSRGLFNILQLKSRATHHFTSPILAPLVSWTRSHTLASRRPGQLFDPSPVNPPLYEPFSTQAARNRCRNPIAFYRTRQSRTTPRFHLRNRTHRVFTSLSRESPRHRQAGAKRVSVSRTPSAVAVNAACGLGAAGRGSQQDGRGSAAAAAPSGNRDRADLETELHLDTNLGAGLGDPKYPTKRAPGNCSPCYSKPGGQFSAS
jgi:hypothetical protein